MSADIRELFLTSRALGLGMDLRRSEKSLSFLVGVVGIDVNCRVITLFS